MLGYSKVLSIVSIYIFWLTSFVADWVWHLLCPHSFDLRADPFPLHLVVVSN